MDLAVGQVIAGRYRVDRKVGSGGMGEVWAGEHVAIGVRVAIKTLLKAAAMNHEVVARFKREAYFLGRIRSDHVARVVDFIADQDIGLVLVMDFVEGDALARVLMDRQLTVEEGIDLACDVASALCDLHRAKVVHRDLKPGNIILEPLVDGARRAVVVDFGVSRLVSDGKDEDTITGITRADMAVGTIEYMAPEQILNSRDVTGGSDLYALGAILYRSVAGKHVFGATTSDSELAQKKLTVDAPPLPIGRSDALAKGLQKVVAKALKRRPSERYKTAEDMLRDLVPLRDQVRLTRLQVSARGLEIADDTTTRDDDLRDLDRARASLSSSGDSSRAKPAGAETAAPRESKPPRDSQAPRSNPPSSEALAGASIEESATSTLESPKKEKRRSLPAALAVFGIAAALVAGTAVGVFMHRKMAPSSTADATPPAAPAPPTSASQGEASAPRSTSTAAAIAAPAPSAASEVKFDDLEPTRTISLDPPPPKPAPKASASATPAATPSVSASATPAAPTASPSAAASAAPSATPSAKASAAPSAKPVSSAAKTLGLE